MNENLQNALAEVIDKSMSGFDNAVNFLSAEIPDVIWQLLLWHGVKNFIYFLMGITLLSLIIYFNKKQIAWIKSLDDFYDHPETLCNMFQIFLLIPLFMLLNIEWLQIWVAPKVWLIEYAAELVK